MVPILKPKMILWHHCNIKMPFLNQRKKRVKLRRMQRACLGGWYSASWLKIISKWLNFGFYFILKGYLVANYSKIKKSPDFPIGF